MESDLHNLVHPKNKSCKVPTISNICAHSCILVLFFLTDMKALVSVNLQKQKQARANKHGCITLISTIQCLWG